MRCGSETESGDHDEGMADVVELGMACGVFWAIAALLAVFKVDGALAIGWDIVLIPALLPALLVGTVLSVALVRDLREARA